MRYCLRNYAPDCSNIRNYLTCMMSLKDAQIFRDAMMSTGRAHQAYNDALLPDA